MVAMEENEQVQLRHCIHCDADLPVSAFGSQRWCKKCVNTYYLKYRRRQPVLDPNKKCKSCGGPGPFTKNSSKPDGLQAFCSVCYNKLRLNLKWVAGRIASDPKNYWTRVAVNAARARSKINGLGFSISRETIDCVDVCPILGLTLDYTKGTKKPNSPSLDRIDSTLGYVAGNVRVISWRANALKSNGTPEELIAIGEDSAAILSKKAVGK